jgi:alanine-synthesizing transaminase
MGNPDQPTPQHIVDKMVEATQRHDTHRYSVSKGIPRLRRAITNWYKNRFNVDLDPETEAIVTIGSKEGLAHLALATLGPGDTVMVPNPAYPIHPYGVVIAGADLRHVKMVPGVDFVEELHKAITESWPKPKMLILNFPSTICCGVGWSGLPMPKSIISSPCARAFAFNSLTIVHDIAYADIVFDGYKAPSILQVPGAKEIGKHTIIQIRFNACKCCN